jgi:hypothetical protein
MEPLSGIRELIGQVVRLSQPSGAAVGATVVAASAQIYADGVEELWLTVDTGKGELRLRLTPPRWQSPDFAEPEIGLFEPGEPITVDWPEPTVVAPGSSLGVRSRRSELAD